MLFVGMISKSAPPSGFGIGTQQIQPEDECDETRNGH